MNVILAEQIILSITIYISTTLQHVFKIVVYICRQRTAEYVRLKIGSKRIITFIVSFVSCADTQEWN